jgi:4-hydroxy-tetrahydrodipicolinate synthase
VAGEPIARSARETTLRSLQEIELDTEIRAEEQNGTNVTGVKAALALMGDDCGATRPPAAWPLNDQQLHRLRVLLDSWKVYRSKAAATKT